MARSCVQVSAHFFRSLWTDFRGLPGPGEKFHRVEEERRHGGKWEDSFFVFVASLSGSTVQIGVEGTDSYESLAAKVAPLVSHLLGQRFAACSLSNLFA